MQKPMGILIRELLLACGALALVAVGIWFFSQKPVREPAEVLPEVTAGATTKAPPLLSSVDTDKDGLPDFEEKLWGTDSKLADTDKDGTSDGDEVASRRNPNKAGPGDALETSLTVVEQPRAPEKSVVARPVPSTPNPVAPPTATQTPNENPLRLYGNAVGTFIKDAGADADAELAFWQRVAGHTLMTSELTQGLKKLAQKYGKLATSIGSVVPPEKALSVHRKLAETYQNYAKAVRVIAETPTDSYLSGPVMMAYSDSTLALARAVVGVSDLFYREQVVFGRTEPGALFVFPR